MNMQVSSLLSQAVQGLNTGDLNGAEALLNRALLMAPGNLDVLNLLGVVLFQKGQLKESLQFLQTVVHADPGNLMACYNMANILMRHGDHVRALEFHERAMRLKPNDYWILMNYGISLSRLRRFAQAMESFRKAIDLDPSQADGWQNLATCLKDRKDYAAALQAYDQAIQRRPGYADAWSGKGSVLHSLSRYEEALAHFDKAIQCNPGFAEAWSNKGATLHDLMRYPEALDCFDRAIQVQPDYYESYWNKSLTQLLLGDFEHGWADYRYRWKIQNAAPYRHAELPRLETLEQARGKTILVWAEQGFGDSLHFARFLPQLARHAARVVFEVQAALCPLFEGRLDCEVLPQGQPPGPVDCQVALLDLPCVFQTRLETIPAASPYLRASPQSIADWKDRLGLSKARLNIGIACSGNAAQDNDHHRSMPLALFQPLLDAANCYLLQKDVRDADRAYLETHPEIRFLGDQLKSFEDTAAIVCCLDLVVSVDTSLAHLTGALGQPLFVLVRWAPDWRYMLDRTDNPWYPSARVFRQASLGDWTSAVEGAAAVINGLRRAPS